MAPKIAILGCGAVGKAVLFYLPKFISCSYKDVTILDMCKSESEFPAVQECMAKGATFLHYEVKPSNVKELLDKVLKLKQGDVVIDVTTGTPTMMIFTECRKRGILFLNTDINRSTEGTLEHLAGDQPFADSLYMYHVALDEMDHRTRHYKHATVTAVNESGMNPGLITTFVKLGLRDIAKYVLKHAHSKGRHAYCSKLRKHLRERDYRGLCETLQVHVIHCSEIDTQRPSPERMKEIRKNNTLVNTWSIKGMVEEATEPCAISLGSHERNLPVPSKDVTVDIVPHVGVLHKSGMKTYFRSYLPVAEREDGTLEFGEIKGVVLPHGETFSLQRFLSSDTYVPTMHYVYQMNPITMAQLRKTSDEDLTKWSMHRPQWKVMNMLEDELSGTDNVGATFLLPCNPVTGEQKPWGWWTGSILNDHYTRHVLKDKYFSPTVIPVMAGILSGTAWALKNPDCGMIYPEAMDEDFIFATTKKYLGRWHSGPIEGCTIRGTTVTKLMVTRSEKKRTYVSKFSGV